MRSLSSFPLVAVALVSTLDGCASGGMSRQYAPAGVEAPSAATSRLARLITLEELGTMRDQSLLTVIRRLRPGMLRGDKPSLLASDDGRPAVYLDQKYLGGPEVLEGLSPIGIREVRRMSETEAFHFGTRRHPAGVIVLKTRN
jgi:hypothetical protein